jgi:hypothetical protein
MIVFAALQFESPALTNRLPSIVTLAVAIALAGSAFAAAPKTNPACEKAHMTGDASAKKCWSAYLLDEGGRQ